MWGCWVVFCGLGLVVYWVLFVFFVGGGRRTGCASVSCGWCFGGGVYTIEGPFCIFCFSWPAD